MGVPSVTSNLSGFGCFIKDHVTDPSSYGIYIVDRHYKSADESAQELTDYMYQFTKLTRRQRINLRNRTERLSELLDWKRLGLYYTRARKLALKKTYDTWREDGEDLTGSQTLFKVPRAGSAPNSPKISSVALPDDEADD
eukprot:Colp12_sorted_trinity150504_noHs@11103